MGKHSEPHAAIKDEVLFMYDILQDNSVKNISSLVQIGKERARGIISRYKKNKKNEFK